MNKQRNLIRISGIVLLSLFLLLQIGCGKTTGENSKKEEVKVIPINVVKVKRETISQEKTFSGTLEGVEQSDIVAKISERITKINLKVNESVKNGKVIIQLDKTGPSSSYLQTQVNYINAKKDFERMDALYKGGAISQQQLDQAKASYEISKANFEAAASTVELSSPISGIITDIKYNVGDWVTPGNKLAVVANIKSMIIKLFVSETEMQMLKMGDKITIYSEREIAKAVTGRIVEISRSASSDARSFQVKASFNNTKDLFYKPGMFVNADVTLDSKKDVIVVPTEAIITSNQRNVVFRISDNRSFETEVKTGLNDENYTEILSGLNEGDTIAILGMNNLKDSTKISIVK
ncbi:MAG: efflux RND transporter periplasmic adaptor subunit [Ignavibacteriaceae bacterium]|nr:efflux RND transporter periplasmic adaptor subunit [Ignavibacteriaceae bacterium]